MYTKSKLIDLTVPLLKKLEGFRAMPYNDNGYLAIGYGNRYKDSMSLPISEQYAEELMRQYLSIEYDELIKKVPQLDGNLFIVPMLSKGYQYGSGIFKLYSSLTIPQIIIEFNDEDDAQYRDRRLKELSYYEQLKSIETVLPNSSLILPILIVLVLIYLFIKK